MKNDGILLLLAYYKGTLKIPFDTIINIGKYLIKLYQCSECPAQKNMYTKEKFDTLEDYNKFKSMCPSLCGIAPPRLPKSKLTNCSFCYSILCPKHANRALKYGLEYKRKICYMCDSCCWNEVS